MKNIKIKYIYSKRIEQRRDFSLRKRRVGQSDLYVSELGLGAMSFKTKDDAINIVRTAIEKGVNFIDTADLYGFGENETWIGEAIKPYRDDVIIATKVGNRWEKGKSGWTWDPSKTYIKEAVKASLKRLKLEYIDLYQLHGGTIEDPIEETIEAFEELKEEGLIRYYGISSIRPNVIKKYLSLSNIVSIMMPYSLLDRRAEELFPLIKSKQVSVIVRGPLAQGALTEEFSTKTPSDGVLHYTQSDVFELMDKIKNMESRTITEVALQFALHDPVVATIIPGASSLAQFIKNFDAAATSPLSQEEINRLKTWTKEAKFEKHRD